MAVDRVQRRMAAILAADVVGYSRLMGEMRRLRWQRSSFTARNSSTLR